MWLRTRITSRNHVIPSTLSQCRHLVDLFPESAFEEETQSVLVFFHSQIPSSLPFFFFTSNLCTTFLADENNSRFLILIIRYYALRIFPQNLSIIFSLMNLISNFEQFWGEKRGFFYLSTYAAVFMAPQFSPSDSPKRLVQKSLWKSSLLLSPIHSHVKLLYVNYATLSVEP